MMTTDTNGDLCHNLWNTRFMRCIAVQFWNDLKLWEMFFEQHPEVGQVIELGTAGAGLSMFLHLNCLERGIEFKTVDWVKFWNENEHPLMKITGFEKHYYHRDIWLACDEIGDWVINSPKPVMFLCDGGDKPREFRTFIPVLRKGDFAAVHDWTNEFDMPDLEPVKGMVDFIMKTECEESKSLTRFFRRV